MTDIVVTIPKTQMKRVEAEEAQVKELLEQGISVKFFWGLGQKPKRLEVGDRCYFVWDGAIRAWHTVLDFGTDIRCDTTGILHPGFCAVLAPEIHDIVPIPKKGFRGFQYFDRERQGGHARDLAEKV